MPVPDKEDLVGTLKIIQAMCCKEHMREEIGTLIQTINAPDPKARYEVEPLGPQLGTLQRGWDDDD